MPSRAAAAWKCIDPGPSGNPKGKGQRVATPLPNRPQTGPAHVGIRVTPVQNQPDYLTAARLQQFVAGLIPLSPTEFFMPMAEGRVTFDRMGPRGAGRVNLRYSGLDHIGIRKAE